MTKAFRLPLLAAAALTAGLLAWLALTAEVARADESCGDFTCATADDFEAGLDGWEAVEIGTTASHLSSHTEQQTCEWWQFGCTQWTSTASGVMSVYMRPPITFVEMPAAQMQKWVDLTPGTYKIVTRFSSAPMNLSDPARVSAVVLGVTFNNTTYQVSNQGRGWSSTDRKFTEYESDTFTVDRATPVLVDASFTYAPREKTIYVDYIWVVRVSSAYPTPIPGTPTLPPLATAVPMPTEVCRPLPTPAAPGFSLTPTPTAAPRLYNYEDFKDGTGNWSELGAGVRWVLQPNHGNSIEQGAMQIDLSDNAFPLSGRASLGYGFGAGRSAPLYVQGWVRAAAAAPVGQTVWLEVWTLDENDSWSLAQQHAISYGRWQAFHTAINSGTVKAIGLTARRTDTNTSTSVFVDDLVVYDGLDNRPYCANYNNPGGIDLNNPPPAPGVDEIIWPIGKPCPPDITEPNNFWGPLLTQITLFLDGMFAFAPAYEPGGLIEMADTFFRGPAGLYAAIYGTIIDLRVVIAMAGIIVASETIRAVWSVWMLIKRTVPFLGGG